MELIGLMHPKEHDYIPTSLGWLYSCKFNGWRCAVYVKSIDDISLIGTHNKPLVNHFNSTIKAIQSALIDPIEPCILDGEIYAPTQTYPKGYLNAITKKNNTANFAAFDIMFKKESVCNKPLSERLKILNETIQRNNRVCVVPHFNWSEFNTGISDIYKKERWEGIVAKVENSFYRGGKSPDWVKFRFKKW